MARSIQLPPQELESMTAFDLFQLQMESGSTEAAIDAMKRLAVVCKISGEQVTLQTILPYLTALSQNNNSNNSSLLSDELLLILGQQLLEIGKTVSAANVTDFLPILEKLAATEETVVRDQAVVVLNAFCQKCIDDPQKSNNNNTITQQWMAVVKRLAGADWFTAKVSATGILATVFELAESQSQKYELLTIYKELCSDETPMVRRAAAKHLGITVRNAGWQYRDFGGIQVPALSHDEQDSVRLLAVASLAVVGKSFGQHPNWTVQYWLPVLKDGSTDMSWYVQ